MNITGQQGIVEGEPRYQRDSSGAWITLRTWRGFESDLLTQADTLGMPCEIQQEDGPIYRLTVSYSGRVTSGSVPANPDAQVVTIWNLHASQQRADLWQQWSIRKELLKVRESAARATLLSDLRAIGDGAKKVLRVGSDGKTESVDLTLDSAVALAQPKAVGLLNKALLNEFTLELAAGVDSFLYDTFVLRKKRLGPSRAPSLVPAFKLVNLPITTAELLGRETSIPASIRAAISGELATGFWLRQSDELNQLDADRIEVVSQWVFGLEYSSFIYSANT